MNLKKITDDKRKSIIPGNNTRSTIKLVFEMARKAVKKVGDGEKF